MILECPQCRSRYLVPDRAIGPDGRTVRCASCRHSWFQAGVDAADGLAVSPMPAPVAAAEPTPEIERTAAAAPPVTPAAAVPADDPAPPAGLPTALPASIVPPTAVEPAVRPRRDPARRWTVAAVAAGVLMLVGVALILWSSAPGLLQRIGLPIGPAETPLRLVDNPIERRDLSNGSELFAVSGKVLNPSGTRQRVPDIRADLRDASGRIVFSWTITPQQRTLAPKSAIDFNSAKLDVPPSSKKLELSFAGESGG